MADRPQNQALGAVFQTNQGFGIGCRLLVQAKQDDGFELQPLGFVNRHHLHGLARTLRGGIQGLHAGLQLLLIGRSIGTQLLQQPQNLFGIGLIGQAWINLRPTQARPALLHPGCKRHQTAAISPVQQDLTGKQETGPLVRIPILKLLILRQLGQGLGGMQGAQAMQALQTQADQWRAQDGQPGQSICRVSQGTDQLHQIRHHRALLQGFQLYGSARYALLAQLAHQTMQVRTCSHQNCHRMLTVLITFQSLSCALNRLLHRTLLGCLLRRHGILSPCHPEMPGGVKVHRPLGNIRLESSRVFVGDHAQIRIRSSRKQLRPHLVHPLHQTRVRAEVIAEIQRLQLYFA